MGKITCISKGMDALLVHYFNQVKTYMTSFVETTYCAQLNIKWSHVHATMLVNALYIYVLIEAQ